MSNPIAPIVAVTPQWSGRVGGFVVAKRWNEEYERIAGLSS